MSLRGPDMEGPKQSADQALGQIASLRSLLPQEPRQIYRQLFKDVAAMNADIFTHFMRRAMVWLKDDTGKLGVIVSMGMADSGANENLRKFLSNYTIERVVPLEWCQVFVANVNPILLFLKKATPPTDHTESGACN